MADSKTMEAILLTDVEDNFPLELGPPPQFSVWELGPEVDDFGAPQLTVEFWDFMDEDAAPPTQPCPPVEDERPDTGMLYPRG